MEKLLLKADEVAFATGLARSTIYQMLARGALPTVRVGSCLRVPAAALRDWVMAQTQGSAEGSGKE